MNNYSLEHEKYLKTVKKNKQKVIFTRLLILVLFFVFWEIAGDMKLIDPFLTSTPSRMWKSLVKIYTEGTLFKHISITCFETILGFLLSTILGTIIAILLWWSDFACKVLDPYLVVLNALPKVALAPIIIFWVGNGTSAIVLITVLISIVVTILNILNGFKEIDEDKIKLLKTFGATKFQILRYLVIPATIPTIIASLKINVGLSWVGVIMGEFLVAKSGIGFLIIFGGQISQLDMVMMSILILSILAFLMYELVAIFQKRITKNQYHIN
ncbi:ABC transporter permease [Clostridium botulinum]|uniref:Sulfonate ABC transporter permease n=1 Tax=Clostridium botulinum C/D str. DC5 TaxID=1443128 RepID=A0A0A0IDI6_CLOBO|nr:ABC transporter permease [Clostridium botulinum]KGM93622.1 sulfonate ABC transporter permease [Clostridium botulinum D str. CCUG 7971]KGM99509.1 sulfonate ABC transporter permease [Clostridium botulinum C/D str. DC5]KOC48903.1 sulfonate ABC transporter permease [Clostridium botulinum]KOC55806.1 sulfonate ABC transporter permease [Clostridium botulinum]KOC56405.1 sulfonate ABC transporter permease [Clostridium botulinum]